MWRKPGTPDKTAGCFPSCSCWWCESCSCACSSSRTSCACWCLCWWLTHSQLAAYDSARGYGGQEAGGAGPSGHRLEGRCCISPASSSAGSASSASSVVVRLWLGSAGAVQFVVFRADDGRSPATAVPTSPLAHVSPESAWFERRRRPAVKWRDGFADSNALGLVAGSGGSRSGRCCCDHGVLRPEPPWRLGCRQRPASRTGRALEPPWRWTGHFRAP